MKTPVLFDTDAGTDIDDLYALALIVRHPGLELLGVTTVGPQSMRRARLVAKMLRLADRPDLPVFAGEENPLARPAPGGGKLTHTDLVRAGDPEHDASYGDAVEHMLAMLSAADRPITIVGTGHWTNIAKVLREADARQRGRIECLALMGGEVHWLHREANVAKDPEAAELVLHSGLPIFLATWSVSRQLFFTMAEVERLTGPSDSPFVRALAEATRMWWGAGMRHKPGPVCYDVLPVFWAGGERSGIRCIALKSPPVELAGEYTRGMLVVPPFTRLAAERTDAMSGEHLTVSDSLDAGDLKRRYESLVFGGP